MLLIADINSLNGQKKRLPTMQMPSYVLHLLLEVRFLHQRVALYLKYTIRAIYFKVPCTTNLLCSLGNRPHLWGYSILRDDRFLQVFHDSYLPTRKSLQDKTKEKYLMYAVKDLIHPRLLPICLHKRVIWEKIFLIPLVYHIYK